MDDDRGIISSSERGISNDISIPITTPIAPPSGWKCPKCGNVWSPTVPGCFKCNR